MRDEDTRTTVTLGTLHGPARRAVADLHYRNMQDLLRDALRNQLERWGRLQTVPEDGGDSGAPA